MTMITKQQASKLGLTAFSAPFRLPSEKALLQRWFADVKKHKPEAVIVLTKWKRLNRAIVFAKPVAANPRQQSPKAMRGNYPTVKQTVGQAA